MKLRKTIVIFSTVMLAATVMCQSGTTVQNAYSMRMNGGADEALELLEKTVADDPANAQAWYELARTCCHLALGHPRGMFEKMGEYLQAAERAAELEPDNLIYAINKANACRLDAYAARHEFGSDATEKATAVLAAYENVLGLNPDYPEARLVLVESLIMLPPEMGGDLDKAEQYTAELEKADAVLGAQAREMMMKGESEPVAFWQKVLAAHPDNSDVLERLGKAFFYQEQPEEGINYLKRAMALDPAKNVLHLDIARYYMYQAMRDQEKLQELAPKMKEAFQAYIDSEPEPVASMKAYAMGALARILSHTGDKEGAEALRVEAEALDPHFSKVSGVPDRNLFIPPDELPHGFVYFSRPF